MSKEKILINDKWNLTEEFIGIEVLQTTDAPYHLASDEKDIRYLAEHWLDEKCEPLYVSYRDGIYRVIEGQKRTLAAKMRFVSGKCLMCKVRRDLKTIEDEARWFYEINHQKRKFSEATEGFLSRQYFDDTWKYIVSCVKESELNISYTSDRNDNYISCLTTLENIFNDFYYKDNIMSFSNMLLILHDSCMGASESLMANFMKGFAVFYRAYKNNIDEKILKKCFVKEDKKQIKPSLTLIHINPYKKILKSLKMIIVKSEKQLP